jgi:hypothetical protein
MPAMGEEIIRGESRQSDADTDRTIEASSGWVTTQQAAKALGITARTVRWHIDKGNLEARPEGEGVRRTWLVSIDSLQALRDARQNADTRLYSADSPNTNRVTQEGADITADIPGNPIRELADRLAEEAAKAAEYRVRLELTERAQSTLEEELTRERRHRAEAEQERDELASRLEALQETREAPETPARGEGGTQTPPEDTGQPRPSWWRRFFFGP